MQELEGAFARIAAAVDRIEAVVSGWQPGSDTGLVAERDRLADEVEALRNQAEADAMLREEAAEAVRQALSDLRGAVDLGASGA